jgi:hypothetical protein
LRRYSGFTLRLAGDDSLWLPIWDEEGIQMPQVPRPEAKMFLRKLLHRVSSINVYPLEITVAGDWAYSLGAYGSDRVVDGIPVRVEGKFLTILKRQPDGYWKMYVNASIRVYR